MAKKRENKRITIGSWFHNSYYLLKFVFKHWNFLKFMIASSKRKKEILSVDLNREDHIAIKPPAEINLYLTENCNLRCNMCPFWGEKGNLKEKSNNVIDTNSYLSLSEYQKIVDEFREYPTFYYLSGGEPTLYPDGIHNLLKTLKHENSRISMNTNGTMLEKYAEELVKNGLDLIIISIDGPEELHDKIRGVSGTFQKVLKGIEALKKAQIKYKVKNPVISTILTVNKLNYNKLAETVRIWNKLGIDMGGFTFSCFTTEKKGLQSIKMKNELFDQFQTNDENSWRGFLLDVDSIDLSILKKQFKQVLKMKKKFMFYTMPGNLKPDHVDDYYQDLENSFNYTQCTKAWYRTYIRHNGDVESCEFFTPNILGNIKKKTLSEIWNEDNYREYRKVIKEEGYFPYCTRCTELYPP